jgi:hypothetical protein
MLFRLTTWSLFHNRSPLMRACSKCRSHAPPLWQGPSGGVYCDKHKHLISGVSVGASDMSDASDRSRKLNFSPIRLPSQSAVLYDAASPGIEMNGSEAFKRKRQSEPSTSVSQV